MSTLSRLVRPVIATLGVAFLCGCYSYVPVERPSPGTAVRVHVPLRSGVQSQRSEEGTLAVDGVVVSDGDTLVIATKTRREFGAFREVLEVDTMRVARSGVSYLEEQVFSKPKTYGLTVLAVAGAAGLVVALVNTATGQKGEGPPGNGGPAAQLRISPFSVLQGVLGIIGR